MKKVYEAPGILFENFMLSSNIAGDCELITSNPSRLVGCAYVYKDDRTGETAVFVEGVTGCVYKPQSEMYNGFCYHVPSEYNNLFNS